jgi:hypothetical protein
MSYQHPHQADPAAAAAAGRTRRFQANGKGRFMTVLRWTLPFLVLLAGYLAGRTTSPSTRLVYVCGSQPCRAGQEFEVVDSHGAPIWSVGEYGGAGVFGDNLKVYAPRNVFHPAVTISWEPPLAYDKKFKVTAKCKAPALWIAPQGTWHCVSGQWVNVGPGF